MLSAGQSFLHEDPEARKTMNAWKKKRIGVRRHECGSTRQAVTLTKTRCREKRLPARTSNDSEKGPQTTWPSECTWNTWFF